MEVVLIALIIQGLVFGFFCSYIAKEKNRDGTAWFWLGFLFSILAVLALIAVPKTDQNSDQLRKSDSDDSRTELKGDNDLFHGERQLKSSSYQLYLVRRFRIEKNATLGKFTIENEVFDTLENSLREADFRYANTLIEISTSLEIERKKNESNDRQKQESEVKMCENEDPRGAEELMTHTAENKHERFMMAFVLFGSMFFVGAIALIYFAGK